MNKGKTHYEFKFSTDAKTADEIVKSWLQANKFNLINKYDEEFYFFNDPLLYGKRGFQYKIDGQTISVDAWTIGVGKKFYMLDSGAMNNMAGDSYKSILQTLFNKICETKDITESENMNEAQVEGADNNVSAQFTKEFENENYAKREKLCLAGFILSIVGVILPFLGVSFGIIIYILVYCLAGQGLSTPKKKLAIAAIIINTLAFIILVVSYLALLYAH
ncbi:MAG: hypothetical protein K6D38_11590 [Pseudobutyrivibrio sp.]|nr:hypothetical protein [Pseudobutyrivibrio sp.]